MSEVYSIITERVIALLEAGVAPWQKPWTGGESAFPKNLASGKPYRGVNTWLLHAAGFESPYWLTYKQAAERGGNVKKGEKSSIAVYFKRLDVLDKQSGEKKQIPLLRYYNVFNVEQTEGVEFPRPAAAPTFTHDRIAAAEAIVEGMPKRPTIQVGQRAVYSPISDVVTVPGLERYAKREEYYSTLFHELAHATGHTSRLDRDLLNKFGSAPYSREELIAEMTAAYLAGVAGIELATIENSAAYLANWINALKGDNKLIVTAASGAQRAADWILGKLATAAPADAEPADLATAAA